MLAELFEFYLEHPEKLPQNYVDSLSDRAAPSRGVRLHCRNDRRLLPAKSTSKPWAGSGETPFTVTVQKDLP